LFIQVKQNKKQNIFAHQKTVGEGRVRWGGWVRWGGCLVQKSTKAVMLTFWHRDLMMLPSKSQYK
ncbi:MAG: hypothetical protein AAGJ80_09760, partial [Cyanobacteria bacterium J06553_1]